MEMATFNLRIPEELNDELIKISDEEGRSKNSQIIKILKDFVKEYNRINNNVSINQKNNGTATVNINNN